MIAVLMAQPLLGCRSAEDRRMVVAATTYDRYCSGCHGLSETGPEPVAGLGFSPVDLRLLERRYGDPLPRAQLAQYIDGRHDVATGTERLMPVWGSRLYENLPDTSGVDEIRAGTIELLLDYLESVQTKP